MPDAEAIVRSIEAAARAHGFAGPLDQLPQWIANRLENHDFALQIMQLRADLDELKGAR